MRKICRKCKKRLSIQKFNWKVRGVKRSLYCKSCSRAYTRNHYKKNRAYYLSKAKYRNKNIRAEVYKYLGPYLKSHPCVDCGESDILVLEFDHIDKNSKIDSISRIIQGRKPIKVLIEEVAKCDVRCANCHRRKTEKDRNSWRLKYAPVA